MSLNNIFPYNLLNANDSSRPPIWVVYTIISSLLCVFGVLLVPLVDNIKKYNLRKKIKNNKDMSDLEKNNLFQLIDNDKGSEASLRNVKLLNYGLSVSAGSMMMTSLYKIIPKSNETLGDIYITGGWIFGILLSFTLNYIVHAYTSESLVHCAHSSFEAEESDTVDEEVDIRDEGNQHTHTHTFDLVEPVSANKQRKHSHTHTSSEYNGLPRSKSAMLSDLCHNVNKQKNSSKISSASSSTNLSESIKCLENCIGYDLKNIDHYRSMVFNKLHSKSSNSANDNDHNSPLIPSESLSNYGSTLISQHKSNEHSNVHPNYDDAEVSNGEHSHLLETPFSKLFSIGLQTCVALSLHKLPEGLILYFSNLSPENDIQDGHNASSNSGGLSIFLALAIHNFIEGFAMCLPIYSAFQSKVKGVVLVSLLGGFTQPLGAFLGYLTHKLYMDREGSSDHGFIHWISLNSDFVNTLLMSVTAGFLFVISLQMLQTAIGFSDSHDHGHRNTDLEPDVKSFISGSDELGNDLHQSEHTFGTGCVKWACFGASLVLLSGIFAH